MKRAIITLACTAALLACVAVTVVGALSVPISGTFTGGSATVTNTLDNVDLRGVFVRVPSGTTNAVTMTIVNRTPAGTRTNLFYSETGVTNTAYAWTLLRFGKRDKLIFTTTATNTCIWTYIPSW